MTIISTFDFSIKKSFTYIPNYHLYNYMLPKVIPYLFIDLRKVSF